eukprot:5019378-Alexandrium_andersonii.AAC.1
MFTVLPNAALFKSVVSWRTGGMRAKMVRSMRERVMQFCREMRGRGQGSREGSTEALTTDEDHTRRDGKD